MPQLCDGQDSITITSSDCKAKQPGTELNLLLILAVDLGHVT